LSSGVRVENKIFSTHRFYQYVDCYDKGITDCSGSTSYVATLAIATKNTDDIDAILAFPEAGAGGDRTGRERSDTRSENEVTPVGA